MPGVRAARCAQLQANFTDSELALHHFTECMAIMMASLTLAVILLVVWAKRTYGYQNLADFCSETSGLNQAWAKDSKTVEKMSRRFLLHVQSSLWFSP